MRIKCFKKVMKLNNQHFLFNFSNEFFLTFNSSSNTVVPKNLFEDLKNDTLSLLKVYFRNIRVRLASSQNLTNNYQETLPTLNMNLL